MKINQFLSRISISQHITCTEDIDHVSMSLIDDKRPWFPVIQSKAPESMTHVRGEDDTRELLNRAKVSWRKKMTSRRPKTFEIDEQVVQNY